MPLPNSNQRSLVEILSSPPMKRDPCYLLNGCNVQVHRILQIWWRSNIDCLAQLNARKECALCGTTLPIGAEVSLCNECMKCADCCVGLEKLRD